MGTLLLHVRNEGIVDRDELESTETPKLVLAAIDRIEPKRDGDEMGVRIREWQKTVGSGML
ncbi:MAG: hypothetical protein WC655_23365 [Candidatus Hydrogenedentales bacterium]